MTEKFKFNFGDRVEYVGCETVGCLVVKDIYVNNKCEQIAIVEDERGYTTKANCNNLRLLTRDKDISLFRKCEKNTRTFGFIDKSDDLHGIDFASVYRISLHRNCASESSIITIFWDHEYTELVKTEFTVGNDIGLEIMDKWSAYMNEDD